MAAFGIIKVALVGFVQSSCIQLAPLSQLYLKYALVSLLSLSLPIFASALTSMSVCCKFPVWTGEKLSQYDATTTSLETSIYGDRCVCMIPKGVKIPYEHSETFHPSMDYMEHNSSGILA